MQKIMKVFDIDPYCSNYPPEMYDRTKVIPFKLDNSDVAFYTYIGMASKGGCMAFMMHLCFAQPPFCCTFVKYVWNVVLPMPLLPLVMEV